MLKTLQTKKTLQNSAADTTQWTVYLMFYGYYHPGGIMRWCCLMSVWRLLHTSGQRAACAAGRLYGAYWLIGPGSAGLAQGCHCGLPLQAWAGHIVRMPAYSLLNDVWQLSAHRNMT